MGLKFGKYGFKRPISQIKHKKTLNIGDLDYMIPELVSKGLAEDEGDYLSINFAFIGVDKVLGSGQLRFSEKKLRVKAKSFSGKAVEKIKGLDGEIIFEEQM